MNLTPKQRFLESETNKNLYKELVTRDFFRDGLEAALAQFVMNLPRPSSPSESWDQGCKIEGAKGIIDIILNLAEVGEGPKPLPSKSLKPDPTLTK